MQDFESGSFAMGVDHSQKVKATPIANDYGSKDGVNLSPSTAVFRIIEPLSLFFKIVLFFCSFLIVAFGQPAWNEWVGVIAAVIGYALFWRVLLDFKSPLYRFLLATTWFTLVQLVQLSWAIGHPFLYIYFIYAFFSLAKGLQFGLLGLLITPDRLVKFSQIFLIAACWTLMEWSRLFFFSGVSWNPVGLALTANLYSLQSASLVGIFGLSFWVMLVNLLILSGWVQHKKRIFAIASVCAMLPYIFGVIHISLHDSAIRQQPQEYASVALVQTVFPASYAYDFSDRRRLIAHALQEWKEILLAMLNQKGKPLDLMVLPEYAVPCGTYSCFFPLETVKAIFKEVLGAESFAAFPPLELPFAKKFVTSLGEVYFVNNAFWAQTISNYFRTGLVIGLEDADDIADGKREHYSAAHFFEPNKDRVSYQPQRYEKRVLVPLGEYIPFEFFQKLAADYGIQGSFTSGKRAKVFMANQKIPFGISICYEETFGNIMRENKHLGAQMLVNLTSDAWYPDSRLPWQHFYHSRLRSVENGIPLARASNMGVTGAVDSLGRVVAILGQEQPTPHVLQGSLQVNVPLYSYWTLYSYVGDTLVIGCCLLSFLFFRRRGTRERKQ